LAALTVGVVTKHKRLQSPRVARRRARQVAGLVLTAIVVAGALSAAAESRRSVFPPEPQSRSPVEVENVWTGTTAWRLPQAPGRSIEGYSSQVSVMPGDELELHVRADPPARYRVEVFRLGWYGSHGARLISCVPFCNGDKPGAPQSVPAPDSVTGLVAAGWPVTDKITVSDAWVSGYYLIDLVLTSGPYAGSAATVPLILREPATQDSTILVVAPVNTWEAYNVFGGKSLYASTSGNPKSYAHEVSFDRPYSPQTSPLQSPLYWEYPLVRFLERYGYDVSYTTDVDIDASPADLERHRLIIIGGHSEYWTKQIRDAYETARDSGTNLAFMGGNDGYWQIRYTDNSRTIVAWRTANLDPATDPPTKTMRFRDLKPARPECQLTGVEWQGGWRQPAGTKPAPGEGGIAGSISPTYTINPQVLPTPG
jgi:hypothetical protein